ncbi:hypothetical protein SNE40_022328 [Patella caerulea]|uniref:1-phosphatidylinositol-3-phosphate 5-kinase n=1 Tax=Patella caerulea TaxID=87958 RepID=A0AAN8IXH7_PATCE
MGTKQPWEDTATTLTEFAPLASEVKPSKNFLSRLWKKDGSDQSNSSSTTGSQTSSREASVERGANKDVIQGEGSTSKQITDLIEDATKEESDDDEVGPLEDSSDGQTVRQGGRRNIPKRTLSNVLTRLGNIIDRSASSQTPTTYKDSDFKQYWMPDHSCKQCYDCGDKFTTFRRRHHCRVCGQIFCSKCCNQELPGKAIGYKGGIRVCAYCCKVVLRYAQDSEYERNQQDDVSISPIDSTEYGTTPDFNIWSPLNKRASLISDDICSPQQRCVSPLDIQSSTGLKILPFDLTPQSEFSLSDSLLTERKMLSRDSVQLREIWRQIQDPVTGVDMQSHRIRLRTYQRCVVGKELVDWLINKDKAAKREQGVAIGQALLYADYLEAVGTQYNIFRDDFTLYKPGELSTVLEIGLNTEGSNSSVEEKSSNEPLWLKEIESGAIDYSSPSDSDRAKSQSETSSRHMFYLGDPSDSGSFSGDLSKLTPVPFELNEEPLPRQDSSAAGLTDEFLKGTFLTDTTTTAPDQKSCPHGWRVVDELREENGEKLAYDRLRTCHTDHWNAMAKQLLSQRGLSFHWEPIILTYVTKISHFVRPDIITDGDNLDIRQYLHVKKVPGGHKNETLLIHGLVFTKNVAHKKMKCKINNPQILLLRGSIDYQRIESKFSSLEPQILQEKEFLRNSVSKIVQVSPNILVVEKTVSRLAQDFLLEAGITLIFNVKPRVMERLSRFTQTDIIPSIDSLAGSPNLGVCHTFRTQAYTLPSGENKTVVIFDGCATHLGCTVIVRGSFYAELKKVKEIIKFMSYCSYNSLLELSYCMDEFALPPEQSDINFEHIENHPNQTVAKEKNQNVSQKNQPTDASKKNLEEKHIQSNTNETVAKDVIQNGSQKQQHAGDSKIGLEEKHIVNQTVAKDNIQNGSPKQQHAESNKKVSEEKQTTSPVINTKTQNSPTTDKNNTSNEQVTLREKKLGPNLQTKRQISSKRLSAELVELTDESDPLKSYQKSQDDSIFKSRISFEEQKHSVHRKFKKILQDTLLSVSPYHKYEVPYLESSAGDKCRSRRFLPDEIYWSNLFEDNPSRRSRSKGQECEINGHHINGKSTTIRLMDPHPFISCKMTAPLTEMSTQALLADFRARGGQIRLLPVEEEIKVDDPFLRQTSKEPEKNLKIMETEKKVDCLDPFNHQKISVLFSSFSPKSFNYPNACVLPWVVTMDFYGYNDITLGGFLQRFCFRESYMCPSSSCETSILDHVRRFTHGKGCINIMLKKLDTEIPGGQNNILMWSWCRKCKQVTPVVPISADTWSLSFAKYLELRFYGSQFNRRASAEYCPHSLHYEHNQYFGHEDILVSFKYSEISLKELALPAIVIDLQHALFNAEDMKKHVLLITNRCMERYSEILEYTLNIKSELQNESLARTLSDFVTEQQTEKSQLRELALTIQEKIEEIDEHNCHTAESETTDTIPKTKKTEGRVFTLSEIYDDIIRLKRLTTEAVVRWNNKIQEFVSFQQKKISRPSSATRLKDKDNVDESERHSPRLPASGGEVPLVMPSVSVISTGDTVDIDITESSPTVHNTELTTPPVTSTTTLPNAGASTDRLQPSDSGSGVEDTTDGRSGDRRTAVKRALMFWSGPSFQPLPLPYDASEHYLLPPCERVPVVVYDSEPSSIIAYALSSSDYHLRLKEIQANLRASKEAELVGHAGSKSGDTSNIGDQLNQGKRSAGGVLSFFRGTTVNKDISAFSRPGDSLDSVRYNPQLDRDSIEVGDDAETASIISGSSNPDTEKSKSSKQTVGPHIELQFCDNLARFYCRVYFAESFRKLRKLIFPAGEDVFIRSLSRCKLWEAKGGKSGSTFCKTDDDRFILKQMSGMEVESFEKFGPQYFTYISKSFTEKKPTALAKIVGVFRIGFRNTLTNSANKQDLLVVENLFYNRKIAQKFDLKGSMRNRLVNTSGKREEELVLLDENLLKLSVESPLYIRPHSKTVLKSAITSDSHFLSTNLVMDYSLIVGLDEVNKELVVGIIDYIRTFTWDKRLEMVFKSSGLMGGHGKMPTVVSPQLYRSRFLEAMERYFLHVPDQWSGLGKDYPGTVEQSTQAEETDATSAHKK